MKIKTEKDQIREKVDQLNYQITWQKHKVDRAYKKYNQKEDWPEFYLWRSSATTLLFIYNKENEILSSLHEYRDQLQKMLLK